MRVKITIASLILLMILLSGCSSISQKDAEVVALGFIKQRVKFFSDDSGDKSDVSGYKIASMDSYLDKDWVVVFHVEANVDNSTKKTDLVVNVDSTGKVVGFNGQKI